MCEFASLKAEHIPEMVAAFEAMGWDKPASQYEKYLDEQDRGMRTVILAFQENGFVGYLTILWSSSYTPFFDAGIPEISDLNVLIDHRKKGVGTSLVAEAEEIVRHRSSVVGIGVGMDRDYGPAQRLYVKLGYIPDGKGIISHGRYPKFGEQVTVNDSLNLYFTKDLA